MAEYRNKANYLGVDGYHQLKDLGQMQLAQTETSGIQELYN